MRSTVTIDETIQLLNDLLKLDPVAMQALVETRVPCNEALVNHPTVHVYMRGEADALVGLMGILNGLFGVDGKGSGPIQALYADEAGKVLGAFKRTPETETPRLGNIEDVFLFPENSTQACPTWPNK